ncbi:hypothetical protein LAZ67_6003620 [Cordylochernes scorpioides]|uniref:Uncharacterized protein n=1 Tax=Cordylochernes scorpioides TaxID=51811 RepID=A0ABY6KM57_9ARAC|nr:hypothetical protein LAZ67_6003620 [Cordylochernes scorpioides]
MAEQNKKRHCIKICQKLGLFQLERVFRIQRAFGDNVTSNSRINPRNDKRDRGKYWIGTANFDRGYGHKESDREILPKLLTME